MRAAPGTSMAPAGNLAPLRRKLAHGIEERPRPSGLALERLREADQVARAAGVELDHAARREAVVRTDQAALRRLAIFRRSGQINAEERTIVNRARYIGGRGPASHQHAHEPPRDDLDADGHLVDLLALHPPHDAQDPVRAIVDREQFAELGG